MSTLNMTEMTTPSQNVSETTTEISIGEFMEYNVAVWVHLAIMIVGLITNPLILIVLRKKKFGSEATRITLRFLAVVDMGCLLTNFLFSAMPSTTRPTWFVVLPTALACHLGYGVLLGLLCTSPWYIVYMTLERFTVVYYLKAKTIFTRRNTLLVCSIIPVIFLIIFTSFYNNHDIYVAPDRVVCTSRDGYEDVETAYTAIWIVFYFMLPAVLLISLNGAILARLRKMTTIYKTMSAMNVSPQIQKVPASACLEHENSSVVDTDITTLSAPESPTRKIEKPKKAMAVRSGEKINPSTGVKTATRLVLSASIAFLVLMVPRGISYVWFTVATEFTDTHRAIDTVVWWLQYVNHSINYFIYVLASKKFRFTS